MNELVLTHNELLILKILWQEKQALSRPEILEKLSETEWNSHPNTIHQMLNSMLKKGVIKVDGMVLCGRVYGRTYAPAIERLDYVTSQVVELTPDLTLADRLLGINAAFMKQDEIDEDIIAQLEEILKQKKMEIQNK